MRKTDDHLGYTGYTLAHFPLNDVVATIAARYPAASDFVFSIEGGYVNDPNDSGGCTNMGITIGTLTEWRNDDTVSCTDVANLTRYEASLIYATSYWAPVWGSQLPVGLNTQVYDFGVNAGPSRAVRELQMLVGAADDGIMGPQTLDATLAAVDEYGIQTINTRYSEMRQAYYESLSSFSIYGTGWTNRNKSCLSLAQTLATKGPMQLPSDDDDDDDYSDMIAAMRSLDSRVAELETWRSDVAIASMEDDT